VSLLWSELARGLSSYVPGDQPQMNLSRWAWRDRPDFSCFQAGNEAAAIARGAKIELGEYADTQGKPEIGPFAAARAN
jgi:hypothetical protein